VDYGKIDPVMINPLQSQGSIHSPQRAVTRQTSQPVTETDPQAIPSNDGVTLGAGTRQPQQEQTNPVAESAPPPALPKHLREVTQQVTRGLIVAQGKANFQQMAQIAQSDPPLLPVFQAMGNAANGLAQGSEPDFYGHLSQSAAQLEAAQNAAIGRQNAGSGKSFGQLLSEEMKVQAEVSSLIPYTTPEMLAEFGQNTKNLSGSAETSGDRMGVELLKQKLPPESVKAGLANLTKQPLFQAAQPAQYLSEASNPSLTALSDTGMSYYPLALGAKSIFFQAGQGIGEHPSAELSQLGQRLSLSMFGEEGEIHRIAPKFSGFAREFAGDSADLNQGFRAATDLSVLLLAMDAGSQWAKYLGEERSSTIKESLQTLVVQQSLMAEASPYLQQASMTAVQNQVPAPALTHELSKRLTTGNIETPEKQYNKHLLAMMSPDQVARVDQRVENHPLNKLSEGNDLAQLQDSFELPYGGENRLRRQFGNFTGNLISIQQAVLQTMS
jgi:hypothetical protein